MRASYIFGLFLLLFSLLWGVSGAQSTPNLTGFVFTQVVLPGSQEPGLPGGSGRDGSSPLAGVTVSVRGSGNDTTVTTNIQGYYQLSGLSPGEYELEFRKDGYQTASRKIKIFNAPYPPRCDVALHPPGAIVRGDFTILRDTLVVAYAASKSFLSSNKAPDFELKRRLLVNVFFPQEIREASMTDHPVNLDTDQFFAWNYWNPTRAYFKPLPGSPQWLTFDRSGRYLYASLRAPNHELVIADQMLGDRLVKRLPLPGQVVDLQNSLDSNHVLVALFGAQSGVQIVDTASQSVVANWPCPSPPTALAGANGKVYLACQDHKVRVYDMLSGRLLGQTAVGHMPTGLALSPDGQRLYCVNSQSVNVNLIFTSSLKVGATQAVGVRPQKVAVSPDGTRIAVSNRGSDSVSFLDGQTLTPLVTTPVPAGPIALTFSLDGNKLFVSCFDAGNVAVLDGRSGAITLTTVPMPHGSPWGLAVRP